MHEHTHMAGVPLAEAAVLQSMLKAKKDADYQRRRDARKRIDIYTDDFGDQIADMISDQFEPENAKEILKVVDRTSNPLKRIVGQISTIYHEPPSWRLGEDEKRKKNNGAKDDKGAWNKIRARALFDSVQQATNEYTNLCNETIQHVTVRRGRLVVDLLTPDNVIVEQDPEDPTCPIALAYWSGNLSTGNDTGYWIYWSRHPGDPAHRIYDPKGRDVSAKFGVDGVNPYRDKVGNPVLPFVLRHRSLPINGDIFDQHSGADLVEGTLGVVGLETWLNHLTRTDSIAQKWIVGMIDQEAMGAQVGGTLRALLIRPNGNQPVTAGQFSSQADWSGMRGNLNAKISNLANAYGLSMDDFKVSGEPASGFSLQVRKEGLIQIRRKQIPLYRAHDLELYDVVSKVWNTEIRNTASSAYKSPIGPMVPTSQAEPEVIYAPFQATLTVQERLAEQDYADRRLALGLDSVVGLFLAEHPEFTEEEAIEQIAENKRLNKLAGGGEAREQEAKPKSLAERLASMAADDDDEASEEASEEDEPEE